MVAAYLGLQLNEFLTGYLSRGTGRQSLAWVMLGLKTFAAGRGNLCWIARAVIGTGAEKLCMHCTLSQGVPVSKVYGSCFNLGVHDFFMVPFEQQSTTLPNASAALRKSSIFAIEEGMRAVCVGTYITNLYPSQLPPVFNPHPISPPARHHQPESRPSSSHPHHEMAVSNPLH